MDLNRRSMVSCGAVTQLAVFVNPPCLDRAVTFERHSLIPAHRDGNNAVQTGHLNRRSAVGIGAVAQLPLLYPQAQAVPLLFSATLSDQPAAMAEPP